MKKKGNISVRTERCKGCGLCVRACRAGVLAQSTHLSAGGVYPVEAAAGCVACGACYAVCPDMCIEIAVVEAA
jgi:2-oxoglutarate ferredoxin oxidoreductase subunit delta